MSFRRENLSAAAILLFSTLLFHPGAWLGRAPTRGDVPLQFIPWKAAVRDALAGGELPFWNPYTFCGAPLLSNLQSAALYPVDWLLLPFAPGTAYGLSLVVHAWIAAFGAYLLARRLGGGAAAALLPALAFAYSGHNAIHLFAGNLLNLFSTAWVPWLWLALLSHGCRRVAGTALVVALLLLCGYPQTLYYALLLGILLQLFSGPLGVKNRLRGLGASLLGVAWGLLLAAIQLFPTLAYLAGSARSQPLDWMAATEFSLAPSHLVCLFLPHWFGNQAEGTYTGHWWDWSNPYAGVAVVLLAILALVKVERKRALPLAAVGLLALLLAMGRYSPLYRLFYEVAPLADRFRAPVRFLPFYVLNAGLLAALACSHLPAMGRRARPPAWVVPLLALVLAADLRWQNRSFYPLGDADATTAQLARVFSPLPSGPERPRLLTPRDWPLHNLPGVVHRPNFSGYDPLYPGDFGRFVEGISRACGQFEPSADTLAFPMRHGARLSDCTPAWSRLALFNVQYAFTRAGMIERRPLPRVWISHWVEAVESEEIARRLFDLETEHDWTAPVLCDGMIRPISAEAPAGTSRAAIRHYRYNRVVVEAELAAEGLLVLADNWAPGWRARVDGRVAPVHRAWGLLRAVELEPGRHEVVFSYTPPGWRVGWITSLLAALALGALALRQARRARLPA